MPTDTHAGCASECRDADCGLPTYLTRFIGRQAEMAVLHQLVTGSGAEAAGTPSTRLVTLCGVGGSGKTRLAIEVARGLADSASGAAGSHGGARFADGVRWVDLTSLATPADLPRAVAAALQLRDAASADPLQALVDELRARQLVLVLDNCEHLADACRQLVSVLLAACPQQLILATSRTPLHLTSETLFAVPPLQTAMSDTDSPQGCAHSEAVRLFLDRASMTGPDISVTATTAATLERLCRRLDGLPLAVELAATWMRVLTPADLLAEIDRSIDFLSSSAPTLAERHRSMRAVLDSSWQRLSASDRKVLSTLSVFSGSFSRAAAEMVGGASLASLSSLTQTYLLQRLPDSEHETRYAVHEMVRQFSCARLEGEAPARARRARQRHLDFFLTLVEQAEAAWDTADEPYWLSRLRTEQSNLDAALSWAMTQHETEKALRLAAGLFSFWVYTAPLERFAATLEQVLGLAWDATSTATTSARARALNVAGYAAVMSSDFQLARQRFDEGLRLYGSLEEPSAVAWCLRGRSFADRLAGEATVRRGDEEESLALCRAAHDVRGEAWSIHDLGEIAFAEGDLDGAEQCLTESLLRFDELGVAFGAYRAVIMLGDVHRRRSRWRQALVRYEEALARQRSLHFVAMGADILEGLGEVAAALQQPTTATRLLGAGQTWRQRFGFARYWFHEAALQRCLTSTRQALGPDRWTDSYDAGRRLTSQQAMNEASLWAQELASVAPDASCLTARELEVLHAVALGLGSAEIAADLVVSPRTVHAHLRSIFRKLEVCTRTAAVHEASRLHLV